MICLWTLLVGAILLLGGQTQARAQDTRGLLSPLFEGAPFEVSAAGSILGNEMIQFNEMLEHRVTQDQRTLEGVVAVAGEMLQGANKLPKPIRQVESLIGALKRLPGAVRGCAYGDYVDLAKFQRAIIDSGLESASAESGTLLGGVIVESIVTHSDNCRGNYLRLYQDQEWSAGDRAKLNTVLDTAYLDEFYFSSSKSQTTTEDLIGSLKAQDVSRRMCNSRTTLLQNVLTAIGRSRAVAGPDECVHILEEELTPTCERFVEQAKAIFRPARFDLALDETKVDQITGGNKQFEEDWRRFRFCDFHIRNKHNTINVCSFESCL